MTRCLVLFPPQWSPFSPHLAPVTIAANIRKAGHKCDVRDLNIEFYREILKKDYLQKSIVNQIEGMIKLREDLKSVVDPDKTSEDYTREEKIKVKKLLKLNDIRDNKLTETKQVIDNVESAVQLLQDKDAFYNLQLAANSIGIINKALEIVALGDFPQELSLYYFKNRYVKLDLENIIKYCSMDTIFSRFYNKKAIEIIKNKYDYIGISVSSSSQFLSSLILAKMLKSKSRKTKICLGGNHISRITDAFKKNPEFFKIFADYIIFEEGERATEELLEHIAGTRKVEDVSSLIYLDEDGIVKQTTKKEPTCLSKLAMPDLKDFPIKNYFLPEIIMPVQLSRGCYWKKCTFCDHDFGQTYNIKNTDILVNELKKLQTRYGINNFEFTDDCISPAFLKEFSKKIIETELKINWYCDLRLENAFTQELLTLANKAGLKMVLWGFEAGSKRIMELINKGIDIDKRFEILTRSSNAGIYNFAYIFTGFPTETYEETLETIHAVCDYPNIVHAYGTGTFSLGKHSLINTSPEKFGIIKLEDDEEFSAEAKYEMINGLKRQDLDSLDKIMVEESQKRSKNPAWMFLAYRELLFLYIVKYGRDAVLNMKYPS